MPVFYGQLPERNSWIMTKNNTQVFIRITIMTSFFFLSCQEKSRKELILGKWRMEGKDYYAQMSLEFNPDKTSVLEKLENSKLAYKQLYTYEFIDEQKYLLLEPSDSGAKIWKIEIVKLDNKTLKLRSQSPDSLLFRIKKGQIGLHLIEKVLNSRNSRMQKL